MFKRPKYLQHAQNRTVKYLQSSYFSLWNELYLRHWDWETMILTDFVSF